MSEYLTDEEQMNRFNDWWKEHGTSLLIAVGVTVAGIVGWNVYSDQRQQTIEAGTAVYAEYVDATDADEKQILAQRIKTEFAGSSFQVLVALTEAKEAVDTGNLTMAAQALRSAGDAASDALLADLASLRLARVQYALGEADAALQSLQGIRNEGYRSLALELTGDIYLAQGKTEQAYAAYTSALDSSGDQTRPLLEIKRDNAAPSGGQFSVFAQPLEQALQDARKTLAADDASDSTSDD